MAEPPLASGVVHQDVHLTKPRLGLRDGAAHLV